jgi:hypothetical protein
MAEWELTRDGLLSGRRDCAVTTTIPEKEKAIFRLPELLRKINPATQDELAEIRAGISTQAASS